MGGKRPDQYNIDPAEGSSTDHKWRHEGRSGDEHLANEEKQRLEANPQGQPMIPEETVNPELRALRERKAEKRREEERGAERDAASRTDERADERIDEASDESFPASDPPAF